MNNTLAKADLAMAPALPPVMIDPVISGFMSIVDRLQGVVDYETESLSRHLAVDLSEINRQKRQGMLELSRVMRSVVTRPPSQAVRDRLAELNIALDRNRAVLEVQLGAVREIAEIIAQVLRDAEWDGTYSMRNVWK